MRRWVTHCLNDLMAVDWIDQKASRASTMIYVWLGDNDSSDDSWKELMGLPMASVVHITNIY